MGHHDRRDDLGEDAVLRTARTVLRRWRLSDRAPFARLNADPVVMEFFPARLTAEESDAMVERIEEAIARDGYGLYALEVPGVVDFAGFVGLLPVPAPAPFQLAPAVEIGWRLDRPWWGKGYASEAATEVLRFAFAEIDLDEVVSLTSTLNVRSQAVMSRIGLRRDPARDFEHPRVPVGSPLRPHVLFARRRDDWLADQAALGRG